MPGLETLVAAVRRRDELESQVIETKALRRSNVVKTTLLRSVSHDLRSPLTAITAAADGLASDTLSEDSRRELSSVIRSESARLSRLVDNLLDLSPHPSRQHRAPAGLDRPRRGRRRRGREPGRSPGRFRHPDRPGPAAPECRCRAAGTSDRERAREREPLRRRPAGGGPGPRGRPPSDAAHLRPRARHSRVRTWSVCSSPSTAPARATGRAPASGSPSLAGSWRPTVAGSGPNRCPARARAS